VCGGEGELYNISDEIDIHNLVCGCIFVRGKGEIYNISHEIDIHNLVCG